MNINLIVVAVLAFAGAWVVELIALLVEAL